MDHRHDASFATTLGQQYGYLQEQLSTAKPEHPQKVEANDSHFLCVWNGLQLDLDRQRLRQQFGDLLELTDFRIIQIVGDSNSAFTASAINKLKDVLYLLIDETLPNDRCTVLEYGYTAGRHDTNWIVNDMIAARPALGARTIANIVGMSSLAVSEWGTEATGLVRHFVLAYDELETPFGSDMWLSDDVMFASYGDKLVCVEGGPQAFAQAVSVCSRGVSVLAIFGAELREKPTGSSAVRFSAAFLLATLKSKWRSGVLKEDQSHDERADLEENISRYLASCFDLSIPGDLRKHNIVVTAFNTVLNNPAMIRAIETMTLF